MEPKNPPEQLSDLEKKSLLEVYSKWEMRPRKTYRVAPLLYAPLNMNEQDLVEEMRVIYNSPLKYFPLYFMWYYAELSCSFGELIGNKATKAKGERILKILRNLKVL